MIPVRTAAISSLESVRSGEAIVTRKLTLLVPSASGGPEYWRWNCTDSSSGPVAEAIIDARCPAGARTGATTERSNALEG